MNGDDGLRPGARAGIRSRDEAPMRRGGAWQVAVRYAAMHFAAQRHHAAGPDDALHVIHANGRGARLCVPTGHLSLLMPLTGRLQLESSDVFWELPAGRLQAWRDADLRVDCPSASAWLALTGPLRAWSRLAHASGPGAGNCIFPRQSGCPRNVRRLLVRLARQARAPHAPARDLAALARALHVAMLEQQRDLHERLPRCSGRTLQRRQQTLARLLRVRHLIETSGDDRPDLARLARSANYSPWHLIRMHREVFGETPSEYASRLRLDRAWMLVRETRMPICEISGMLGFESQSSFCRAFKNAYGATTGEVRQQHAPAPRPCGAQPATRAA